MPRKYTEKRMLSNRKWDAANLDRMSIALPKGSRDRIKAHANMMGESVNQFIGRAIDETMETDVKAVQKFEKQIERTPSLPKSVMKEIIDADLKQK